MRNEYDLGLIVFIEPRFTQAPFPSEYPQAWHANPILKVTNDTDLPKSQEAILRFFEKFILRGQVLLDQAAQDPTDAELADNFCRYFEVYLQDMDCYARDPRVARLRDAYVQILSP